MDQYLKASNQKNTVNPALFYINSDSPNYISKISGGKKSQKFQKDKT